MWSIVQWLDAIANSNVSSSNDWEDLLNEHRLCKIQAETNDKCTAELQEKVRQ